MGGAHNGQYLRGGTVHNFHNLGRKYKMSYLVFHFLYNSSILLFLDPANSSITSLLKSGLLVYVILFYLVK